MNNVKAYELPESGLRFLLTNIPDSESCAVSLMIKVGSIYEPNGLYGGAHVIEHMMFKGTKQYPDKSELSRALDSMGAQYNAYTDYTMTSYHIKVQKKYLREVINIMCQMVSQSLFRKSDLKAEIPVVIEELRRERDDPAAYINELFYEIMFKHCKLGRSIGGTIQDVEEIKYKPLKKFWRDNYTIENIVISIAGNATIEEVVSSVKKAKLIENLVVCPKPNNLIVRQPLQTKPRCLVQKREKMNQIQIALGFPCFGSQHPDRFALKVLKCVLGGNMSSRLFITLRDEYSLAYTVSATIGLFNDVGEFSVYSGVDGSNIFSGNLDKNKGKGDPLAVIFDVLFKTAMKPITQRELKVAKEYLKGNYLLGFEDNQNICEFYGKEWLLGNPVLTIQANLDAIQKVTINDVFRVAQAIIVPERMNLSLIGDITQERAEGYLQTSMSKWRETLNGAGNKDVKTPVIQEEKKWYEF